MKILILYIKERFYPVLYIPLAFLLGVGLQPSIFQLPDFKIFAIRFAVIIIWLFAFRLLDDLLSRRNDRVSHPERIYIPANNARILIVWLIFILIFLHFLILVLFSAGILSAAISLLLYYIIALLAGKYIGNIARSFLVMIKYPAISFLAFGMPCNLRVFIQLGIIYCIALIYEVFHDNEHMNNRVFRYFGYAAFATTYILFAILSIIFTMHFVPTIFKLSIIVISCFLQLFVLKERRTDGNKIFSVISGIIYLILLSIPGEF